MSMFKRWWANELPTGVKFVFLVLLANAVPAILILMTLPNMTEDLFVWTINPVINARLIGVMYANALILIAIGVFQTQWARVRIIMVVITSFSILATTLTFFFLKPFLAHPWFHLTYWLTMYLVLFFAAPYFFVTLDKKYGGRLPVSVPLNKTTWYLTGIYLLASLVCGLGLIFHVETVNLYWPWELPPLVGGLIGVLFITHTFAYAWALWDGDWMRIRPIIWQALPTGLLFILLPLLHSADLNPDAASTLPLYFVIAGFVVVSSLVVILSYRPAEKRLSSDD